MTLVLVTTSHKCLARCEVGVSPVLSQGHLQETSGAGLAQHLGFGDSLAIIQPHLMSSAAAAAAAAIGCIHLFSYNKTIISNALQIQTDQVISSVRLVMLSLKFPEN